MTVRDNKRKRRQLAHSGVWHRGNFEPNEVGDFAVADKVKLDGIESGATADLTGAEIKALYEAEADTNAFTDAEQTKLAGIETAATADQTAAEILAALLTVDGSGSGLDADLLDGVEAAEFVTISGTQTITGQKTFDAITTIQDNGGGRLQFNNATWGGRVARIFAANSGNFVIRPASAADTDFTDRDFRFRNDTDKWQFDRDLEVGNDLYVVNDTFLRGTALTPAFSNTSDAAIYSGTNRRLEISTVDAIALMLNHKDTDASGSGASTQFRFNGTAVGVISHTASTTAYGTSSDERLKANERALESVLDPRVLLTDPRAAPYRYERTDDRNRLQDGMLAQRLAEIVPQAVIPGTSVDDPWMIDYGRLTPYLMAICRYQEGRIDDLEARIAALETR